MNDIVVLCYHGISPTWPAATSVTPEDFDSQLTAFAERGYRGATLRDALTTPPDGPVVVVTFDDAHSSVLSFAAPTMARLGIPGTIFVPTDYPGTGVPMAWDGYDEWMDTEHRHELDCMSWDDLRGLAATGWEIGSHTKSHPRLSQLDDAAILAELTESRAECEAQMGSSCWSFAYPYSDFDDRAVQAAAQAGYRFAVTVPRAPAAALPLQWPRVGVYNGERAKRVLTRTAARRLRPGPIARTALALRRRVS